MTDAELRRWAQEELQSPLGSGAFQCDGCGRVVDGTVTPVGHSCCDSHRGWMAVGGQAWHDYQDGLHPWQTFADTVIALYIDHTLDGHS